MRYFYLFLPCLFSCSALVHAQTSQFTTLGANNIRCSVNNDGHLFRDSAGGPGFEVPQGNEKHAIFSSHLWLGGINMADSILHLAAERYNSASMADFWPGPVATNYDSTYDATYNRLWIITQADIQNHLNGISSAPHIMDWPAHGNVANGEAANLAPFVDVNNNGLYEPSQGDYPMFKGDKCAYFIFNDARAVHTASGGNQIGAEVHCMVYQYSTVGSLYNTAFVSYSIFNRSANSYRDFYIGQFTDTDIGVPSDDYVGVQPGLVASPSPFTPME